nr:hypothetical protein [Acidobacteriota bacterium]
RASGIKGGAIVRASFSSVVLDGVGGSVEVRNSNGTVEAAGLAAKGPGGCNNVLLDTSFSPIRVYLPEDGSYSITAKTSFGKITSELQMTVQGVVSGDSLTGTVGKGECKVQLTNSNGSISILRATSAKNSD